MVNASSVSFSGSVAAILLASGFLLTPEARQPPADAPPAPVADHNTFVSRYCASCHNDRLKRRGLTLDAVAAQDIGQHPEVYSRSDDRQWREAAKSRRRQDMADLLKN